MIPTITPTATATDLAALALAALELDTGDPSPALFAAVADALTEAGEQPAADWCGRLRQLLAGCGRRVGRRTLLRWYEVRVKEATAPVWEARFARRTHPEGSFDDAKRWYPSDAENADRITRRIRRPSRTWPNTYNRACRSRAHVRALVEAGIAGLPVPADAARAAAAVRAELVAHLRG